jgi:tetratricopeptide (TPR) repeat protein
MPPRHPLAPDDEYPRFAGVVDTFYAYQDELLGEMMRAVEGRYAIMLVSDHGFRVGEERPRDKFPFTNKQPVEWHREVGVWALWGGPARRGARVDGVTMFDIAPTVLHLLGLPRAGDMPGQPVLGALQADFVRRHPPVTVASYEGYGSGPPRGGEATAGLDEVQTEMLANLAALGYIAVGDIEPAGEGAEDGSPGGAERTNVTYHRNLATYYMNQRRFAEAEKELRAANEIEELPKTYSMLSECLAAQGRPAEAVEALRHGLEKFPVIMSPTSVLYMVEMQLAGGRADLARADFAAFRDRLDEQPALAAAIEGRIAEAEGDPPRAEAGYRRALDLDPTLVQIALRLWPMLEARRAGHELSPVIEAGLAREERIDEYHNMRGVLRMRGGDLAGAIASLERAVFLSPDNDQFQANLGLMLLRAGRKADALEVYRRAAEAGSANPVVFVNLGVLLAETGAWEESLAAYERADALGPGFPQAVIGRSTALARLGRADESRQVAREGVRRFPDEPALRKLAR